VLNAALRDARGGQPRLDHVPGLLHGAYECLHAHASPELKARYLGKVASGEWLATMCLTEAHAGADLACCAPARSPPADGSYRIKGTKIFISGGEHDLTDNIVHLVLARLPDAPAGTKGISLFLAPKFLLDGRAMRCAATASRTRWASRQRHCVMAFEGATGWLVGEPNRGLAAMFAMMNAARLHVACRAWPMRRRAPQRAGLCARAAAVAGAGARRRQGPIRSCCTRRCAARRCASACWSRARG
jgi:alkylation response protein AidB-like acyl-CoA dehydrogenase